MAWNEVFDFLMNHECAHLRQSVQANNVLGVLENLHIGQVVCYSVAVLVPGCPSASLGGSSRWSGLRWRVARSESSPGVYDEVGIENHCCRPSFHFEVDRR